MNSTHIQWTNSTYNPLQGCKQVSPGYKYLYMHRERSRHLLFALTLMLEWFEQIQLYLIWIRYNSITKMISEDESTLVKFKELHWELARREFLIPLKHIK